MKIDIPEFSLNLSIKKGMNDYFSLIQNCQIKNRKSDIDILQDKLMLTMRPGEQLVGNSISNSGQTSNGIFFTGVDGNRHMYVGHGNKVYKLVNDVWTDIGMTFTNNNFSFNIVQLPHGNPSTTYTSSGTATGACKLKPDAADTNPAQKAGKVLMIVGNDNPSTSTYSNVDKYRNKYSRITDYDAAAGNEEYQLGTLGNADALPNGVKYKIFDGLENYLQITNGVDDDQYYDGTAIQTIFKGRINSQINRFVNGFKPERVFFFNGLQWVYRKGELRFTPPLQHLWFDMENVISMTNFDTINEVFVWNNRLIVGGERSVSFWTSIDEADHHKYKQTIISNNYGMIKGGVNNFSKDVYFLTNNKQMISLAENQYGIVIPTNVGAPINNYLQKFNYAVVSGFDGRKFYIYGEETAGVTGTICVYDTNYNFWSTYTGISPSKFILEKTDIYILNSKKGETYKLVDGVITDNGTSIIQALATVDLDGNNIFQYKEVHNMLFHFENLTQEFTLDTIKIGSKGQFKNTNEWSITEQTVQDNTLGESGLGESVLGGNNIIDGLPLPYILAKETGGDAALVWIFQITGKNGSPFYLNDMKFQFAPLTEYFSPEFTI